MLGKFISKSKKYQVHNESGVFNIGDEVKIRECRPFSKRKSWICSRIVVDNKKKAM